MYILVSQKYPRTDAAHRNIGRHLLEKFDNYLLLYYSFFLESEE